MAQNRNKTVGRVVTNGEANRSIAILMAFRGLAKRKNKWARGGVIRDFVTSGGVEIPKGMVNVTLEVLCQHGLVQWREISEKALREEKEKRGRKSKYEFSLTPKGEDLVETYLELAR